MIKLFQTILLAAAVCAAHAGGEDWMTDFEAAKKQAEKENKVILADFTGSDWCPPCMALNKKVLTTQAFKKFAAEKFVLVEIDFPRAKKQSPELKKANQELQEKYKIEGFPTIMILDSKGNKIEEFVGYGGEDAEKFIAKLQKVLDKRASS